MKLVRVAAVVTTVAGLAIAGAAWAPSAYGQSARSDADQERSAGRRSRELTMLSGRGAEIGVRIVDTNDGGVRVDEVQPDGPAEKAGVKANDVVVEFDGERVRSSRQFARLVQETPPGRTVNATVVRDGQRRNVQITPGEGRMANGFAIDGDRLRDRFGDLEALRQLPFDLNLDLDLPGLLGGGRLGIAADDLTQQLAEYFGVKGGVLVAAVTDGSAAARAGIRAGDIITSVNGRDVRSREDLLRAVRDASGGDVSLGLVRDRKELTVTAKIEPPRRQLRGARPL